MTIKGLTGVDNVEVITLSGDLKERNTPEQPCRIIPVKKDLEINGDVKYTFPAYSYTIMKYEK